MCWLEAEISRNHRHHHRQESHRYHYPERRHLRRNHYPCHRYGKRCCGRGCPENHADLHRHSQRWHQVQRHYAATKAGTYTITATITNPNYKLDADTATAEFTVAKRSATVTPDNKSKVYEEKDPELTYKVSGVLDSETLEGITLARAKGENAGKYAITATADAGANPNYAVTFAEGTFTIELKSIKGATVVLGKGLAANGAEQTQTVEKVLLGDKEIPADSYTVTANTATAHGIYTLTITAKGNYTDSIAWTYVIAPSKAEDAPARRLRLAAAR